MKFRPNFRQRLRDNARALDALATASGKPTPPALEALLVEQRKPPRQRAKAGSDGRPLERDVQAAVMELLRFHPRVTKAIRFNSGAAYGEHNGKKYYVKFASETVVDVYFFGPGLWGWLEIKRPGWTHPTDKREEDQATFLADVRAAGGIALFVTDAEQVAEALR